MKGGEQSKGSIVDYVIFRVLQLLQLPHNALLDELLLELQVAVVLNEESHQVRQAFDRDIDDLHVFRLLPQQLLVESQQVVSHQEVDDFDVRAVGESTQKPNGFMLDLLVLISTKPQHLLEQVGLFQQSLLLLFSPN